jgi:hypothetical protein
MTMKMVRVYDDTTKSFHTIPACELAPGMVRAQVPGIDGEVWMDASTLGKGPLQQGPFPESLREILRGLQATFREVYPRTLEGWEEDFRRETDPQTEIAIWRRMAEVYEHFVQGQNKSAEQKRYIFEVICTCVNNGPENVLRTTSPRTLSRTGVKRIVDYS